LLRSPDGLKSPVPWQASADYSPGLDSIEIAVSHENMERRRKKEKEKTSKSEAAASRSNKEGTRKQVPGQKRV